MASEAFLDIGLNALWHHIDSFVPIFIVLGMPYCVLKDLNKRSRKNPGVWLGLEASSGYHQKRVYPRPDEPHSQPYDKPLPPPNKGEPFFPALRQLHIRSVALLPCSRMLRALQNPKLLRELETRFIQSVDEAPCLCVCEYLDTVSGRLDSQVLTKIKMHVSSGIRRPEGSEEPASYRATPATLQLLLMFDNMQHCNILLQELDCDDDFLASIGLSWPRLRMLSLPSHPLHQSQSHLTPRGLYPLAKGCPQLTYLALNTMRPAEDTLHIEDLAPTWDRSANSFSEPLTMWLGGLKRLAVGKAPEVAGYLKAIFPNVEHVFQTRIDYWINRTTLSHMYQEEDYVRRDSIVLPPDNLYPVVSFFCFCPSYLFEDQADFSDDFGYIDSDVDENANIYDAQPDIDSDEDY